MMCTTIESEAHVKNSASTKKVFSVFLAIVFALCASGAVGFLIPGGMYLSVVSIFSSLLLAFLFGFAGMLPVIVMSVSMLAAGFFTGGWVISAYLFMIGIFPGAVMIYGSRKGLKFFVQVRNALIAEIAAFVIVLLSVKMLTNMDFATLFKSMFDEMMRSLSPEARDAFSEQLNILINQQYAGENAVATEDMLAYFSEGMEQTLSLMMPVAVILYSFSCGAIGVLWMNWLRYRNKEENVEFVPLRGWRLSKQVIIGLIVVSIAVLIIGNRTAEAGVSAKLMVVAAITCAAYVQASASFLTRLSLMGVSKGKRTVFLVLMILFTQIFFFVYGILSALFGSRGLFTPKVRMVRTGMPDQDKEKEEDSQNQADQTDENEKEDK